jgi:hypothetical protein
MKLWKALLLSACFIAVKGMFPGFLKFPTIMERVRGDDRLCGEVEDIGFPSSPAASARQRARPSSQFSRE